MKYFRLALLGVLLAGFSLLAIAQAAAPTFTLTWTAPTTYVDGSSIGTAAITYQVYAGPVGKEVKLGSPVTSPPYVITPSPPAGTTQCFQVSAIVNGVESMASPEVCGTIPKTPNGPTTVIITIK